MAVRIGTGTSTEADPRTAAIHAASGARAGLGGGAADLAIVFATGGHLAAPEATVEGVHEAIAPSQLVGCGAGGVLGGGRELEDGTAVVVWAASLDGAAATAFHAQAEVDGVGDVAIAGLPELDGSSGVVLMPDPDGFPTELLLGELQARAPGVPAIGGVASAHTLDGSTALFYGDRVLDSGAVGVSFSGLDVLPCVSQGAAPVGPELTITAAEGHVVHELAGAPALEKLREVIGGLGARERELVSRGVLIGILIGGGKPEYGPGDFLVRGLLGADPEAGAIAVGAAVETGQVVRLHARDAESADRDLHESLDLRVQAMGGGRPAGALCFTCNGRGRDMFGVPDHDSSLVAEALAGAPAAGFFAAGEIGPVGGESHLHGFTATLAIFPA